MCEYGNFGGNYQKWTVSRAKESIRAEREIIKDNDHKYLDRCDRIDPRRGRLTHPGTNLLQIDKITTTVLNAVHDVKREGPPRVQRDKITSIGHKQTEKMPKTFIIVGLRSFALRIYAENGQP